MNRIISLIGFGPTPGKNFFQIDGCFFGWEEGLDYIRRKLNTLDEAKVDEFIFSLPEEMKLWVKSGKSKSVEDWLKDEEAKYREQCFVQLP